MNACILKENFRHLSHPRMAGRMDRLIVLHILIQSDKYSRLAPLCKIISPFEVVLKPLGGANQAAKLKNYKCERSSTEVHYSVERRS